MVLDVILGALVCATTRTDICRVDRSALLQKRWRMVLLYVCIARMDQHLIACFAFNESMKSVLAHAHGVSTLTFQTKNNCSGRVRFVREKLRRFVYFIADHLAA